MSPLLGGTPLQFPTVVPPDLPKISLFGGGAVQSWLDMPGVELAVEATFVQGADVKSMRPEARLLPLAINLNDEGKRTAQVGRQHQTAWFESKLSPAHLGCISRSAFEILWSDQSDVKAGCLFALQTTGSGIVQVNGIPAFPEQLTPILPGARVTLAAQVEGEAVPLITFALHFRVGGAGSSQQASCPSAVPRSVEPSARPPAGSWWLMCKYADGLTPDALQAIPPEKSAIVACPAVGHSTAFIGRQTQPEVFEALLRGAPEFNHFVSRSHLQLEPIADGDTDSCQPKVQATNLSPNVVLIDELTLLQRGESALLRDGQTVGFTAHGGVPFLTFRLVAPTSAIGCKMLALEAPQQLEERLTSDMHPEDEVVDTREEGSAALLEDVRTGAPPDASNSADAEAGGRGTPAAEEAASEKSPESAADEIASSPRSSPKQPKCGCHFLGGLTAPWKRGGS